MKDDLRYSQKNSKENEFRYLNRARRYIRQLSENIGTLSTENILLKYAQMPRKTSDNKNPWDMLDVGTVDYFHA